MVDIAGSRILVLGAAGFIGKELCRNLLSLGADLVCFDRGRPSPGWLADIRKDEPRWVLGDFSDVGVIQSALDGVDYVYHLISTTIPDTSDKDLPHDLVSNVVPTLGLLDALKSKSSKKVVFVSSGGTVYGVPRIIPIPESHETDPICGYGIHKLMIEKYLHWYNHNYGMDYCVLRLSNPYGPSQISDRPQGAIGKFVYKALRHEPIEIWGDGNTVRDYIYMDDVLVPFLLALEYSGEKRVFNVGSGAGHSLLDIANIIEGQLGHSLEIHFSPARSTDVPLNVLDISRIKSEFHWNPSIDIHAGIHQMIEQGQRMCL